MIPDVCFFSSWGNYGVRQLVRWNVLVQNVGLSNMKHIEALEIESICMFCSGLCMYMKYMSMSGEM